MLYAHSAILIEADTGEVLFEKNADEIMFPASTTKIMTAYIALQMSDLENDVVTVSQNAIDLVPPTYQTIPLIAGEQVPMLDLISVMLIRSGNEAANAVAEYLAGSVESFADLMNQTAQMLGCSPNTHFANPSGVHDEKPLHHRARSGGHRAGLHEGRALRLDRLPDLLRHARHADGERRGGSPPRTIVGSTAILNPEKRNLLLSLRHRRQNGLHARRRLLFRRLGDKGRHRPDFRGALRRRYPPLRGHPSVCSEYGFTQIESITPESLYAEDPRVIDIGF